MKIERQRLGLSKSELATACESKPSTVSYYFKPKEEGGRYPDAHFLRKLYEIGGDPLFVITGKRNEDNLDSLEKIALLSFNRLKEGQKSNAITYMTMLEANHIEGGLLELETLARQFKEKQAKKSSSTTISQSAVYAGKQSITTK